MKLYFGDTSYDVMNYSESNSELYTIILSDDTIDKVKSTVDNAANIIVMNGSRVIHTYTGYSTIKSIRATECATMNGNANGFEIIFSKPIIDEQVAQNTANIEYIASMSNVELL